ncbi:MAG: aminopeptidase N [Proteobacteria bacterium]|nr:aminopeptidase N [Desulfobulbaceae bacterium]MBU4153492.1 aminopeptidase N [Pseudomonadota bacterium]
MSTLPQPVLLKDYRPFPFHIATVDLCCNLFEDHALITATMTVSAIDTDAAALRLDGRELELIAIAIDGQELSAAEYQLDSVSLIITAPAPQFTVTITSRIKPQTNTSLEGLYRSHGMFCTQCEAEGFRKITFFPDRPDVLSRFTTTIEADQTRYPVLLANGNLISTTSKNGRHTATWQDPFAKPCYLFAMVAGNLAVLRDQFITRSGRTVTLEIYTELHNADKCEHAMRSLQKAMAWDENRFSLEYDLDQYMIVAVDDFNAGAMENKGLNIFNSKFILARPETATDHDYQGIEAVVAHEYFHNWTGNRVTCRDWFQLSLKEGLTVFRDQEFSADTNSRAVHRIHDVSMLRNHQFPEDAGPMAHPVRPESYIEINNFYTLTVYEKGAEVIRMLHTILGEERFQRGMKIYLEQHDGGAATTDDFVAAMEKTLQENTRSAPLDLSQFKRWYEQAGTPQLTITSTYDPYAQTFHLTIRQEPSPRAGDQAAMLHIPVVFGLLGPDGKDMPLSDGHGEAFDPAATTILHIREAKQTFTFTGIKTQPVPSLLRGFSAPVRLNYEYSDNDLRFLLLHDQDSFNRWEAGQRLFIKTLLTAVEDLQAGREMLFDPTLEDLVRGVLAPAFHHDKSFIAQTLTLPSEEYLAELVTEIDVDAIHGAREFLRRELGARLRGLWLDTYEANQTPTSSHYDPSLAGPRRLKNLCLHYLLAAPDLNAIELCLRQFHSADNMTDQIASLNALIHTGDTAADLALEVFYQKWQKETLVLDKWFALQATVPLPGALNRVKDLLLHEAFDIKNPNKVRALIGAFATNQVCFHDQSGTGYQFLADQILTLDPINPHIAARLTGKFAPWRRHIASRQALIQSQLQRILAHPGLSKGVYEVASRTLG